MKLFTSPLVASTFVLFAHSLGWTQSTDRPTLAWTYEQAVQELGYHPADAFVQYVALQLVADSNAVDELKSLMGGPRSRRQAWMQRNAQVDLYSIFSGSLAVQESLQLDAMTTGEIGARDEPLVTIDSLNGPMVDSHPWREMLGDQKPTISKIAQCVPDDYLFIRFDSIGKFQQMREFVDAGYIYAVGQSAGSVRSAGTMARLQKQWLMESSDILDPLLETGVAEFAIASSDLFYGEGTDATLIMRLKEPAATRAKFEQSLTAQVALYPQATQTSETFLGVPFTHVTTPDRSIHAFVADPTPELHVRSNSRAAFERILRTILNKSDAGQDIRPLGDSDEFRYVRTLMPLGANEEDGFVYLSDPFIRNLIGPQKKLTQRNRLVCRSRLLMLRHAQLLFMTQHGRRAKSIQELRDGDCLGNSESPMELICPNGGEYSLIQDGKECHCSHHGTPDAMVPCCEIPVTEVPESYATEYRQFADAYTQYWRTFFDPIALRVQLQPNQTRAEMIVLPLINNSIYTGLSQILGGEPEQLDSLPIPHSNVASLALKLDKNFLLEQLGIELPESTLAAANDTIREDLQGAIVQRRGRANDPWRRFLVADGLVEELALDRFFYQGIGNQIAIHLGDDQPMVDFSASRMAGLLATFGRGGQFLNPGFLMFGVSALALTSPFYISVPVNDGAIVDDTLVKLDHFLAKLVRREDILGPLQFIEFDTYRLTEDEASTVRTFAFRFGPVTWRFYWLRLDNALYISNLPTVVADLRTAVARSRTTSPQVDQTAAAHGLLRIRPEHWNQLLPHFRIGWAESERHICLDNLPPLSHAARALLQQKGDGVTLASVRQLATDLFGGPLVCPTHGEYSIDPDTGRMSCSLHGTADAPQQPMNGTLGQIASFAESLHDVRLELTFMEDGLHTIVTIENKSQAER